MANSVCVPNRHWTLVQLFFLSILYYIQWSIMVHFHLYQICRRTKNLGGQMSFHLGFGTLCHFSTFVWKHISQTLGDNRSSYEAYILKSVSMKDDKRFVCQSNSSQKSLLYSLGLRNNIKQQVKFFG